MTVAISIFIRLSSMALATDGGGAMTDPGAMEGKHFHILLVKAEIAMKGDNR